MPKKVKMINLTAKSVVIANQFYEINEQPSGTVAYLAPNGQVINFPNIESPCIVDQDVFIMLNKPNVYTVLHNGKLYK